MIIEGKRAYERFMAIRLHLYSSYDFFKYQGKMRPTSDAQFLKKHGVFFYKKLDRKYQNEIDLTEFFLANLIDEEVKWIGSIAGDAGEQKYLAWRARIEAFSYHFRQDVMTISDDLSFHERFLVPKRGYPQALHAYLQRRISLETLIGMDEVMKFIPHWREKIKDPTVWKILDFKIQKYRLFLPLDEEVLHRIMKEAIHG